MPSEESTSCRVGLSRSSAATCADDRQAEQHQAETDQNASGAAHLVVLGGVEQHDADEQQPRPDPFDVDRVDLRDERGADVGAEHDGERQRQRDQLAAGERGEQQRRRGRALQQAGDADAGARMP